MARKHKLEDSSESLKPKKSLKTWIPSQTMTEPLEDMPQPKETAPLPEEDPNPAPATSESQPEAADILAPHLSHLAKKYCFARMTIKANSKINSKVTMLIRHMSRFNFLDKDCQPGIVVLDARSSDASKMLSVVEITKRELMATERSGKWYQYSRLSSELTRIPRQGGKGSGKKVENGKNQDQAGDDEDEGGVSAGDRSDTKLRAVPLLMIYMARLSIPELKQEYGEQTNEAEFGKKD